MKKLLNKYKSLHRTEIDYAQILEDTSIHGKGENLVPDDSSKKELAVLLSEIEAKHDFEAVLRLLTKDNLFTPEQMNVSCELEYQMFFKLGGFKRVLYIGCGAYPVIVTYVLERDPSIRFDCMDISPYATVMCDAVAKKLDLSSRIFAFTGNAFELTETKICSYDAFFLSSAVKPKLKIIQRLLDFKNNNSKIYAREARSHPYFYEPVNIKHPDLLSAKEAYRLWELSGNKTVERY